VIVKFVRFIDIPLVHSIDDFYGDYRKGQYWLFITLDREGFNKRKYLKKIFSETQKIIKPKNLYIKLKRCV